MSSGPLPPHERTWRHPSEVAAEQRAAINAAPPEPGVRRFALATGLVAFALLTIALVGSVAWQGGGVPGVELQASAPVTRVQRVMVTLPSEPLTISRRETTAKAGPLATSVLGTPIGDGSIAVVPARSLAPGQNHVVVELPNRTVQLAEVRDLEAEVELGGLSIVELHIPATPMAMATEQAIPDDIVLVWGDTQIEARLGDVTGFDLPLGTQITNLDGQLVAVTDAGTSGSGCTLIIVDGASLAAATNGPNVATDEGVSDGIGTDSSNEVWSAFGERP